MRRTDTRRIPVTRLCAFCRIRLRAIPDDPVPYRGFLCHPSCAEAAACEDANNRADALASV